MRERHRQRCTNTHTHTHTERERGRERERERKGERCMHAFRNGRACIHVYMVISPTLGETKRPCIRMHTNHYFTVI